jgi:hypothetical protein
MKRRRSESKEKAPFPLAAMLPEMQAEVLTHLSLRDLFLGTCLASKTLHALTHKEVKRRLLLLHGGVQALPAEELPADCGWGAYPGNMIVDDRHWLSLRRRFLASLSWRSRCHWQRLARQCEWIHTLWIAQSCMITSKFLETPGHDDQIRVYSPTGQQYWLLKKDSSRTVLAVASPGLPQQHGRVSAAVFAVNDAQENVRSWNELSDVDDALKAEGLEEAVEELTKAMDNLFHVSFMELDMDLMIGYNGWHMGRPTLWQFVPIPGHSSLQRDG